MSYGIDFTIRMMRPDEVDIAIAWAREEGWNPGIHDGACHYAVDPEGWFIGMIGGEPAATAVATNYDADFSFGGFFIVRPEFRGMGLGIAISRHVLSHVGGRNFGIDGVFEMQEKYRALDGFIPAYRNIRWEGHARGGARKSPGPAVPLTDFSIAETSLYDRRHFPAPRTRFLERWVAQPDTTGLAVPGSGGEIAGYGVIRRCFEGYKIGPLFADTPRIAEDLLSGLVATIPGETFYLDTPEPNGNAAALARRYAMTEVFGTARMYSRSIPPLPLEDIYGVTGFELG